MANRQLVAEKELNQSCCFDDVVVLPSHVALKCRLQRNTDGLMRTKNKSEQA